MKIKILHILHSLQIGGLENGVVNLINRLNSGIFEHAICCIDSSGPMAERLTSPVEIYTLNKGDRKNYLLPFKMAKVIKEAKPDIVHTRNWAAIDGVIGAKLAGVKHIIHGEHGREATDLTGANSIRKKVRKALNPWVSKFITVSAELRNWLIYDVGLPEKKIIQIINGVNTEWFKPSNSKESLKEGLGVNSDAFVIGTVGRLDLVKDHETLFRAFKIICDRKDVEKVKLLVVGEGPLRVRLESLAKDINISKKIIFTQQSEDITLLYNCMDVYVLPSIAEGISNTILEAMACGLPVVATRVGGNHELVDDGKTGFIFTSGDYKELAERLFFYSNNLTVAREHGFNGRMKAEEKFPLSRMLKEYEELYCTIADY